MGLQCFMIIITVKERREKMMNDENTARYSSSE
jgi:hypothetical protein